MRTTLNEPMLVDIAGILTAQRLPSVTIRLRYVRGRAQTLTREWCLAVLPCWSPGDVAAVLQREICSAVVNGEVLVLCIGCVPSAHSLLLCHRHMHTRGAQDGDAAMTAIRSALIKLQLLFWETDGHQCACGSVACGRRRTIVLSLVQDDSPEPRGRFIFRHQVGAFVFLHFTK